MFGRLGICFEFYQICKTILQGIYLLSARVLLSNFKDAESSIARGMKKLMRLDLDSCNMLLVSYFKCINYDCIVSRFSTNGHHYNVSLIILMR